MQGLCSLIGPLSLIKSTIYPDLASEGISYTSLNTIIERCDRLEKEMSILFKGLFILVGIVAIVTQNYATYSYYDSVTGNEHDQAHTPGESYHQVD